MVLRVIRPTWKPETDEHHKLLAECVAAVHEWRAAEARMWQAFARAKRGGVALNYAAEQAEIPRATLYRHLPPNPRRVR